MLMYYFLTVDGDIVFVLRSEGRLRHDAMQSRNG